jgi:signal-transduction protein with cAMP-binding, CBS, and nucleotidyltransferase domain
MDVGSAAGTLESIMRSPLYSVEGQMPVIEALRLCAARGVHHLPLFEQQQLIGVVCTCDLEEIALTAPVKDAIHRPPVTLDATASLGDAVRRMSEELVGSVLIMRGTEAVGIVTREDLKFANTGQAADFACDVCGATTHLKRHASRGTLCLDCRSRATPAASDDGELGGSD